MTKHTSATPLPSPLTINHDGEIIGPWRGNPPLASLSVTEKLEVVRRANVYLGLVEQLHMLVDSHEQLERERGSQRATHTANASALLRELEARLCAAAVQRIVALEKALSELVEFNGHVAINSVGDVRMQARLIKARETALRLLGEDA